MPESTGIFEYKCPCCGGAVKFDSALQKLHCPFCDTELDIDTLSTYDNELKTAPQNEPEWEKYDKDSGNGDWKEGEADGLRSYICNSCGGEIVGDETMAATSCPYCDNPVVIARQFSGMFHPDYIIPFKLDKEAAKQKLRDFIKKKPLLPDLFKTENRIDSIKGIYVPFWLYNCDTDANLRFRATRVHTWADTYYNYTRTDFFMVMRGGQIGFDRVPVDGSEKMDDAYMEAIEPYDYSAMTDFATPYLAGYLADKYDVDVDQSVPRANARIKNSTVAAFSSTVKGYATCIPEQTNVQLRRGETRYALLPVWLLNTKYNNKMYTFAMNGQTGKFVGELPVDKGKYWKFLLLIAAGALVVGELLALLLT